LFFVSADSKLMAVEIKTAGDKLQPGIPKALSSKKVKAVQNALLNV